jgi:hypothetical protein
MERTRKYYRDRAAYMYQLAAEAETDALRFLPARRRGI